MAISNALASVAVKNFDVAVQWYTDVLKGLPSIAMPGVAEWKFQAGGGLQVYKLPERAGAGSFTLVVDNIEEHAAHLDQLKIDTRTRTADEKVKTVMITDPDGNHVAFAEALDPRLMK